MQADDIAQMYDDPKNSLPLVLEKLSEIKMRYEKIIEATTDGFWELKLYSGEAYISPKFKELLGYTDQELDNSFETLIGLSYEDDFESFIKTINNAVSGICEYSVESRLKHKSGFYIWVHAKGAVFRDKEGSVESLVCSVVDITGKKEIEIALKASENALKAERNLFIGGPVVIFKWSAEEGWPILYVSPNVSNMLFASDESLMSDNALFSKLIHPSDIQRISGEVSFFISSKTKSFDQEYRLLRADGSYGWFHDFTVVEYDKNDNPAFINGYLIDITAKKSAEETIRLRERQLSAVVDNLPVGVFYVTKEGGVILSNKAGERIWGKVGGVKPNEFVEFCAHFSDGKRLETTDWGAYKSLFAKETILNRKLTITAEDGTKRVILESSVPVSGDGDEINGAIVINEDVTKRDAYEKELQEAKEAAESANRLKSEFLANISHEIRTPLNAVLGFAELLKNETLGERAKTFLDGILVSGRNLLTLINDILDLSKIEAGKMAIAFEPTDLKRLLQELKIVFDMKAKDKGVDYELIFEGDIPDTLMLDEARVRQILFNLLGNAVKFTDKGSVKLTVFAKRNDEIDGRFDVTIEVQDTGIGIPNDQLETIFEPFKQMDGQNARKYGGTGLGLSISKKLADIMGAKIIAKSEPSKGSVFALYLAGVSSCEPIDGSCSAGESRGRLPLVQKKEKNSSKEPIFFDKNEKKAARDSLQKEWIKANRLKSNDEIEEFAKAAQKCADEIGSRALKLYADKLLEACEGFKATLIRRLFEEFETLIRE